MENIEGLDFLREKKLHKSPEVKSAVKRAEQHTAEKFSDDPNTRIQNYLDRLKNIIEPPELEGYNNFDRKRRNLEMLKGSLHDQFVIKPNEIPEGYFQNIIQRHEEEGRPIEEIPQEIKTELAQTLVEDQKNSLDLWIDYLTSDDAKYPDWLKYFAFRNLLVMGRYDKKKKKFTERAKSGKSVSPFPDLNREALGYVFDAMEKKQAGKTATFPYDIQQDEQNEFEQYLDRGNFPKLYAWAIEKINPISEEMLKKTEGKWRTFPKGSDHLALASSLANYGTGWCIRGESTAKRYLSESDLEIFYSFDEKNEPKIPRVVIVTDANGRISEVRGVAEQENLDPYIGNVVDQKLAKLPDGKAYEKRSADMKLLTQIKNKTKTDQELSKDDLIFLYEINAPIQYFGYQKDPRINELRSQRNPEADMLVIFECAKDQIAHNLDQVNKNTKAYIGAWDIEIFQKICLFPNIKHLYEQFPDKKIFMPTLKTDPAINTPELAEAALKDKNIWLSDWGEDILSKTEFSKDKQTYNLVRFTIAQLGFPNGATTQEIYNQAEKLGLELCPAEVGLHLRLQYTGKEWMLIAMEPIADRAGNPLVFLLDWYDEQLSLYAFNAKLSYRWHPDYSFVFRLRKLKT